MPANKIGQHGQIGLIILLIMTVMLSVGVSIASRTVSEVRITQQEEESTRALNLAESAVESLLSRDLSGENYGSGNQASGTLSNGSIYQVVKRDRLDITVQAGHTAEVNLVGIPASSSLNIAWTAASGTLNCPNNEPAIVLELFKTDGTTEYSAYDSCTRSPSNNFLTPSGTRNHSRTIDSTYAFARVKVLYANANLTVTGSNLPVQYYEVTTQSTTGDSTRAVAAKQFLPALPSIFDYVLFSGAGLTK